VSTPMDRPELSLLAAVELVAAWTHVGNDPGFFWEAVERVMSDICSPAEPEWLAALIFGLSSLGGILLDQLAGRSGQDPAEVLGAIAAL